MKKLDVAAEQIGRVVRLLLDTPTARKVTLYLSPTLTVKASRKLYEGDKERGRYSTRVTRADVQLTIGAPNYQERRELKLLKKVCEPFPVKKLYIKHLPVKR
jgi:hypothetical protein